MPMSRRKFLKVGLSSLSYFTIEATTPNWIMRSAQALGEQGFLDDRILVIVQLAGGNDGLNTVIPRTDPVYYDAATRPTLRVPAGMEITLDALNGLHPQLSRMANWYQRGMLAVVQNVGYANPNLSHFSSTDYWEFGNVPGETLARTGWTARFFDNACAGAPSIDALEMVIAGKSDLPDALSGSSLYVPPSIKSASSYAFTPAAGDRVLRLAAIHAVNNNAGAVSPEADFVRRSANLAEASTADIAVAAAVPVLLDEYTTDSLGNGLKLVSQIIRAGFGTSIFYVSQGGYDTHSGQVAGAGDLTTGDHPVLLGNFDLSLNAFLTEMELSGNLDRVVVMTFSEFGRRVAENSSRGCDHGAANSLMILGGPVAGGIYGGQPNLTDLIKGNLKYKIDFRSVYSEVMEKWMLQPAGPVFGDTAYNAIIKPELSQIPFIQAQSSAGSAWRNYA